MTYSITIFCWAILTFKKCIQSTFVEWGYKHHIYVGLYFLPFPVLLPLSPYSIIQIGSVSTLDLWRKGPGGMEKEEV